MSKAHLRGGFLASLIICFVIMLDGCDRGGKGSPDVKSGEKPSSFSCCDEQESAEGTEAATVDGSVITVEELDAEIGKLGRGVRSRYQTEKGKKNFLNNMVTKKILYLEAKQRGLDKSERVRKETALLCRRLMIDELWKEVAAEAVRPERLREYYEAHPEEFAGEEVEASHILISCPEGSSASMVEAKRKEAQKILKRVAKPGADFAELAKRFSSDDTTKSKGGKLGPLSRRPPPFASRIAAREIFSLKKGEVLKNPVRTAKGFHIFKVTSDVRKKTEPFDKVKDRIRNKLRATAVNDFTAAAKKKADIKINAAALAGRKKVEGAEGR